MQDEEPLFGGTPFRDAHSEETMGVDNSRLFYALLNVEQDASDSQIRDAYKTLASK